MLGSEKSVSKRKGYTQAAKTKKPFKIITGKTLHFTSNEKLNKFDINISHILFKAISTHTKTSLNN